MFALYPPGVSFPFPVYELAKDGITIVHSYAGPPADMRAALEAIAARAVDVSSLITHRLPLTRIGEAFRLVETAEESLKVIIAPQE